MVAVEPSLRRIDGALDDADGTKGCRDDVADPLSRQVADGWTKDAGCDRLLGGPDPHPVAEVGAPGAHNVRGGPRRRPHVSRTRLTGQHRNARRQCRMVGQVKPLLGPQIDHAVVTGDRQQRIGWKLFDKHP